MWKGPIEDGVTQSLLNRFMKCPFSFYIYAILGLEDPGDEQENLIWGDSFHKGLEILIQTKDKKEAIKIMLRYLRDRYPQAPASFKFSLPKMLVLYSLKDPMDGEWETESIIDEKIAIDGQLIRFRGKKDGVRWDHPEYGKILAEHKCKGYIDPSLVREEIGQDLQCNLYMRLFEIEWVAYDLIRIPDTQKYGPSVSYGTSVEEFVNKLYKGPIGAYGGQYPINLHRYKWIHQHSYYIPLEEQEEYWDKTLIPNIKRLCVWYDYVTQPDFDFENPKYYNEIFYKMPVRHFDGRKTEKFKCEYHAYLTGSCELSDLKPVNSYFSELEDE